ELGALLHDVGQIRLPDAVLGKPGALDQAELRILREHPRWGVEILEAVPLLTPALDVVASHHERWDGSGYPHGLKAAAIPLTARVFAVVDTLEAMTHARPHRPALALGKALEAVGGGAGREYDPHVVGRACETPRSASGQQSGSLGAPCLRTTEPSGR